MGDWGAEDEQEAPVPLDRELGHEAEEIPRPARRQPREPTVQERIDHEVLHEPFRVWCRHCMAGRGRKEYATWVDRREDAIAVMSFDYGYMKSRAVGLQADGEVVDDAEELQVKKKTRRAIGRILLKGTTLSIAGLPVLHAIHCKH